MKPDGWDGVTPYEILDEEATEFEGWLDDELKSITNSDGSNLII